MMIPYRTPFSHVLFIQWALTYVLKIREEEAEALVIEQVVVSHVGIVHGLQDLKVHV